MSETLDFVIGGMPRGGTTATGNIFNVHPDSYCYAAETHWLPILMEFAEFGPVPKTAFPQVERIAMQQNRQVLFEMARFAVSRGANPRSLIFEESDLGPLTTAMVGLMRQGLHGRELCQAALPILRRHIVERTGKQVVGEKTPNNVFAFDAYGALGTKAAFMIMREPFAVVRSMHNRGKDSKDIYASVFRSNLVSLIGIWNSYVEAILDARRHESSVLLTYEKMVKQPMEVLEQLYKRVGLRTDEQILKSASGLLKEISRGPPWADMPPAEQALIWHLTKPIRERAGYGDDFYDQHGFDRSTMGSDLDGSEEQVVPVFGANSMSTGETLQWLMKRGCLAIQSAPGRRSVTLKLWSNFPPELLQQNQKAKIAFSTYGVDKKHLASAEARGGRPETVGVTINLADIEPAMVSPNGVIRLVAFDASHAYRSYLTAVSQKFLRFGVISAVRRVLLGGDRRQMSFALTGVEFG
jgi:hypothetical protein